MQVQSKGMKITIKLPLWEDKVVVEALNSILEGYPNLKYDQESSEKPNNNTLQVKVKNLDVPRTANDFLNICKVLEKEVGRRFIPISVAASSVSDWNTTWTRFYIHEYETDNSDTQ